MSTNGLLLTVVVLLAVAGPAPGGAAESWPDVPDRNQRATLPAQEWTLRPGPRTIEVLVHYPGGKRANVTPRTGIMLSLHNWGGTDCAGTASPKVLAERLDVVAICVNYLQSGPKDSIEGPEPYDFGYLQALDALRALHWMFAGLNRGGIAFADDRIFATGGSGGGNVTLMACKLAPRTFTAVVDLCGMKQLSDDIAFHLPGGSNLNARYRREPEHPYYLARDHQELRWLANPAHLKIMADVGATTKIVTVHGADDRTCPFAHAVEFAASAKAAGLDIQRYFLDAQGNRKPIRSADQWLVRKRHILRHLQAVMGQLPGPTQRVPLDIQVVEETRVGKITRRKLTYQSDPASRVPAYLFLPDHEPGRKRPAVLCLQQTTPAGKDEPAGLAGDASLHYALHLAQRGYVTLAPDYPSFGEYAYSFGSASGYASGSMKAVWDNVRAVDLLQALPDVDGERLGCIGHSLGGHNAMFTATFEPRLKAIVANCGFTSFRKDDVPSWTGPRYMPRIASLYANDADRIPFDFPELIGCFAPRPFLASAAEGDADFDVSGVRDCIRSARKVYALYDARTALEASYFPGPHAFPEAARSRAYAFLDRHLNGGEGT